MNKSQCQCFKPPFNHNDFNSKHIGIDKSNGLYAEVTIQTCLKCNSPWLNYFFEIEAFENSGQWYRGLLEINQLAKIKPEKTINYLNSLEWHFRGGSFYSSTGCINRGEINL